VKTKEEADSILKELDLKGKALKNKFIELAKEKSVGPSGPKGGDLGYFAKGQMVPEFNDKVFSMKVGTVSKPVKTQFGYHLIYLEDKRAAKNLSFKEVKEFITNRLKLEKFKESMALTMKKLQDKATITQ
jgi:parvulin-like peptidyl-prolyl isomerase